MDPQAQSAEEQLLRDFLGGQTRACRLVEGWAKDAIRFNAYGIPVDEHADLVQLTLTKIWGAVTVEGFALKVSLRAFVRRIAAARCIDWIRMRKQTTEVDDQAADPGDSPYEELLKRDEVARLQEAMARLDESCREILRLHYFEEMPYKEIAARLDRAPATLRVRVFHCVKKLRQWMSRWE